jgi:NAD(P)-dependent dehydrogenase (short-subunit alcohol dehydrogenase family)
MQQLRKRVDPVTPAMVETAYASLLRDREIRRNLAAMKQAGARVHYYQADVRDEDSFGRLVDEFYASYGRIDAVIHGAGIIEDKLIEDKKPDSFDCVFRPKR